MHMYAYNLIRCPIYKKKTESSPVLMLEFGVLKLGSEIRIAPPL